MGNRHSSRKKGSGNRREELLQVRVADVEKEAFEEAASLSGIALSAWVRERLRSIAARELEAAARPVPFLTTDA
jgi:predicted HicB family RNase H-like nuclease